MYGLVQSLLGTEGVCTLLQKGQKLQYLDGSDWVAATVRTWPTHAPDLDCPPCNHTINTPVVCNNRYYAGARGKRRRHWW